MKRKELGDDPRIKTALARLDKTVTTYEHKWCLEQLRFYEDTATVVQQRMALNYKESFERVVRTARR